MLSKIKAVVQKFFSVFQGEEEEKPEYTIPKSWKKGKPKTLKPTKVVKPTKPPRKIKIKLLRPAKRLGAFLCFIASSALSVVSLTMNPMHYYSIFFLLNSYILLDYLWKTRKPKKLPRSTEEW